MANPYTQTTVPIFASAADLRSEPISRPVGTPIVYLEGVEPGDGDGGWFLWSDSNTAPDDGASIIIPNWLLAGATGGWIRATAAQAGLVRTGNSRGPISGPVQLTSADDFVLIATGTATTATPEAAPVSDREITLKADGNCSATNTVTWQGTIDGQTNPVIMSAALAYCTVRYSLEAGTWSIIG